MPLIWTSEKPTQPGWYWTRTTYGKRVSVTIQRVKQWDDGSCYVYAGKPVERHQCEWSGPLTPPQEPGGPA